MTAIREAITNAVMHRDWFNEGANVFVEIYSDRIVISSPGGLPAGISANELGTRSVRRNPVIADLLHRIGFIEKAGTGIDRMREAARELGSPEPVFRVDEFFSATFRPLPESLADQPRSTGQEDERETATPQVPRKYPASTPQVLHILATAAREASRDELQTASGLRDRMHFAREYLQPLLDAGWIEMTIPDRPRSSKQRYRITTAGEEVLHAKGVGAWSQRPIRPANDAPTSD
jgi:ATP-dependent DNA helicase RecG